MATVTPYRSTVEPARDGFGQLLRAEWTKLRTVGRWVFTLLAAVALTVIVSLVSASGSKFETTGGGRPAPPVGPDGLVVQDAFHFVQRTLTGDGSIVARVSGMTGAGPERIVPEWAKAGVIVKRNTTTGSPYAALMMTKDHGVRLQSRFVQDTAGSAASSTAPRWLKLTRSGSSLTGYESADGGRWHKVGTVTVDRLSATVRIGLFVASPAALEMERSFGSASIRDRPTRTTAVFDHVTVQGSAQGSWAGVDVGEAGGGEAGGGGAGGEGAGGGRGGAGESHQNSGTFTVTSSGDIAPLTPDNNLVAQSLSGAQLGLILFAALGALFITAEYRRGMIRTTLAASPRRGRVLLAKAVVVGAVTFAAGLVAAALSFALAQPQLRAGGHRAPYFPELSLTDGPALRAVIGTAAILALTAVFALGLGALLRNTAAAITVVVVVMVLPLILVTTLPLSLSQWLQRLTPAAGFAIQDTRTRYDQVASLCLPEQGCYPQGPWLGFGTLCAFAAVALALAVWRLRRRDA